MRKRDYILTLIPLLLFTACKKEGIQYTPDQVVVSSATKAELLDLQRTYNEKYASAKRMDKGLLDLASAEISIKLNQPDDAILRLERRVKGAAHKK